jgi:oxygen-independent coproporphyrinogen-3 oxidase
MLHRGLKPYQGMVMSGIKPVMALMEQTPVQSIINRILGQLERGFLDLQLLIKENDRLADLKWLYDLWEQRGLVQYNGVYRLTVAGQFWQVNIAQTTVECVEFLLLQTHSIAVQGIAAQDGPRILPGKLMPPGHPAIIHASRRG